MGSGILVLLLGVVAILFCPVTSNTHDNVKALLTNIFTTNSYNKVVRPAADQSKPIILYVDLNLIGITDIDEVQEKMTTTASLFLLWQDDYMKWEPSDYNDTFILYVPQKNIWKPDIALENGFTKMKELGDDFVLAPITSDGTVSWLPYEVFETKCSINIQHFPFDIQTCDLVFGVWTSSSSEINVLLGNRGVLLDEYQSNGEWDLITTSAKASVSQMDGAIVTFSITIKRKPQYIIYNVVLPIIMLSLLSVFVFALPVDSGEKMGYIMTVYLAFAVFLTIVSASLPVSSTMSLLGMYLIILLILGTVIVLITTLELRIHFRDSSHDIPKFLQRFVRLSKMFRCSKSKRKINDVSATEASRSNGTNETETSSVEKIKPSNKRAFEEPEVVMEKLTWPDVTSAIDFFCFWFFLLATITLTVTLFLNGYIESNI
ncbi:Neuronal acetylcholine receptor subunit alpha-3 [Mizuhopecten yessoensis]|uniref:Neuronal acetylcholine receptor subunit alpha-3 n=1 Tax=Mizuhopecten yessoensis TaxID=6573 RepID=A0A210QR93_MIZYE|nr:Neuronal acetylcholine receptor subunit alpha-3 [Mizuhopecten yessoensis]